MMTRAASIRGTFLLSAALITGQAAQAQWCPNNASAGFTNICLGEYSLESLQATGLANTAIGYNTLEVTTTGGLNTAVGAWALWATSTASENTAVGYAALTYNDTGTGNTAVGSKALEESQTGNDNTAVGYHALQASTGAYNTATGALALLYSTSGAENTAYGYGALYVNSSGNFNTAVGGPALQALTTGSWNLALGINAGVNYSGGESNNIVLAANGVTGESGVTRIGTPGTQTRAFIAGIYGATTASGTWVMVNSAGQLGTTTSSLRFKEDVADMGEGSADLMKLRPVTFHYRAPYDDGQRILQYGLVAEEVAAVNPGLVQFGEDGKPLAVRYHFVDAMLLNEVQKQHSTIAEQAARLDRQAAELTSQRSEIASQEAAIRELSLRLARLEEH